MAAKICATTGAAILVLMFVMATTGFADARQKIGEFRRTFTNTKASNLEKSRAIKALPRGDKALAAEYRMILETDVWQWRAEVMQRVQTETSSELLDELFEWVADDTQTQRQPAAAEHLVWALMNNERGRSIERYTEMAKATTGKRAPDKLKNRVIRELGVWRGVQPLAKHSIGLLLDMLDANLEERRPDELRRFLIIDSLESLSSEEFGDNIEQWRFWYSNLGETPLEPRKAESFEDEYGDIEIKGHSFVRKKPRPVDSVDVLILPEFGYSEQYWYPYIFEMNKLFNCVFVELPDASRVKGLQRPTDRAGNVDNNAYYYPLKQLVEAFEERRDQSGQKKVGIIAHGVSGWIAMEYCRLHPESVAFCIIMNTWSGNISFSKARNQLEGDRDDDFKYYGAGLVYDPTNRVGYGSLTPEQQFHHHTGAMKRMHMDAKAIAPIFYNSERFQKRVGGGSALVPQYEFENAVDKARLDVPVMFVWGKNDKMYVQDDLRTFQRAFPRGMFEVFPNSARVPWAEEPVLFYSKVRELLEKNGIKLEVEEEDKK